MKQFSTQTIDLSNIHQLPAGDLILFGFSDSRPLSGFVGLVDWRLNGWLSQLMLEKTFLWERNERLLTYSARIGVERRIFLFGLGSSKRFGVKTVRDFSSKLWETMHKAKSNNILLAPPHSRIRTDASELFFDSLQFQAELPKLEFVQYQALKIPA